MDVFFFFGETLLKPKLSENEDPVVLTFRIFQKDCNLINCRIEFFKNIKKKKVNLLTQHGGPISVDI